MDRLRTDTIPAKGEGDEIPNEETLRLLERREAGTEPLYGPFDSVEEMFAALNTSPPPLLQGRGGLATSTC